MYISCICMHMHTSRLVVLRLRARARHAFRPSYVLTFLIHMHICIYIEICRPGHKASIFQLSCRALLGACQRSQFCDSFHSWIVPTLANYDRVHSRIVPTLVIAVVIVFVMVFVIVFVIEFGIVLWDRIHL